MLINYSGLDYSIVSETGPLVTPNNTANGPQVGPFTFKSLPTTIAGNSQAVVNINFNPTNSGNFAVYVHVRTDGGTKIFDVVGTAGTYPVAVLEFQAADGSGKWIPYTNNSPPFSFGNVFEQQTKIRKMRLTNNGSSSSASLSITVSKVRIASPILEVRVIFSANCSFSRLSEYRASLVLKMVLTWQKVRSFVRENPQLPTFTAPFQNHK